MSNTIYIECLKCCRLLGSVSGKPNECPNCGMEADMTNGDDYADCGYLKDSDEHKKRKCDCVPFCETHATDMDQDENDKWICEYCEEEKEKIN